MEREAEQAAPNHRELVARERSRAAEARARAGDVMADAEEAVAKRMDAEEALEQRRQAARASRLDLQRALAEAKAARLEAGAARVQADSPSSMRPSSPHRFGTHVATSPSAPLSPPAAARRAPGPMAQRCDRANILEGTPPGDETYAYEQDAPCNSLSVTLAGMANALRRRGKHDEALDCHRKAMAMQEQELGPRLYKLSMTYTNIASILRDQHKYDDALKWDHKGWSIRLAACSPSLRHLLDKMVELHETKRVHAQALEASETTRAELHARVEELSARVASQDERREAERVSAARQSEAEIAAAEDRAAALRSELDAERAICSEMKANMEALFHRSEAEHARVLELEASQSTHVELQARSEHLSAQLASQDQSHKAELVAAARQSENQIAAADDQATALQSRLDAQTVTCSEMEAKMEALVQQNAAEHARVLELDASEAKHAELQARVEELSAQLASQEQSHKAVVTAMQDRLTAMQAKFDAQKEACADTEARMASQAAELEAQIAATAKAARAKKKWLQRVAALQSKLGTESTARGDIERLLAQAQAEADQAMAEAEQAEAERLKAEQERMRLQAERDLLLGGNTAMLSMQVDALLQGSWAKRSTYTFSRLLEVTEGTDPALKERVDAYTRSS